MTSSVGNGLRPVLTTFDNLDTTLNEWMDKMVKKAYSEIELKNHLWAEEFRSFYNGDL